MLILQTVLIILTLCCAGSIIYFTLITGISPMPSSGNIKKDILEFIEKEGTGKTIYELGSGWGNLAFSISDAFPGSRVMGYERSTVPYLFSIMLKFFSGRINCSLKNRNFFSESISDGDIIVCYLCPDLMSKLKTKFENELKKGTLVISSTFAVPGWKPEKSVTAKDFYRSKVYAYRI